MDFSMPYQNPQPQQMYYTQTPMGNNFCGNNVGGYPYGYPPMSPQMNYTPSINPNDIIANYNQRTQQRQYNPGIPGVTSPIEVEMANGDKVIIPPSNNNAYTPGGSTISQNGFNPMTGNTSYQVSTPGFNPYVNSMQQQFIGNPGYYQNTNQPKVGFEPYSPTVNPYAYNQYGVNMYGYGQNSFDKELQEILYNEDMSVVDIKEDIAKIMLSDEERSKISSNYITGYDYYGRPIYNSNYSYQISKQRQEEFEQARKAYQDHFTMLSKISHAYFGEQINEDQVRKRFDPVPPQQNQQFIPKKMFNPNTATEEEKEAYISEQMLEATRNIEERINYAEQMEAQLNYQKEEAFRKIKESHDRLIGVEPGQHYDLKTYMDNGYKINIDMAMKEAKKAQRDGTRKYSRNDFRNTLSKESNIPIPFTSKNDDYISIENILKNVYEQNKRTASNLLNSGSAQPNPENFNSEMEAHMYFLQAMSEKNKVNDVLKAIS